MVRFFAQIDGFWNVRLHAESHVVIGNIRFNFCITGPGNLKLLQLLDISSPALGISGGIILADRTYDIKPAQGGHGGADPVICKDFVDMILHGTKTVATPLAGRMSVAAGVAATESIRNNSKPVDIPELPDDLKDFVY